jgi:hypothetical protein
MVQRFSTLSLILNVVCVIAAGLCVIGLGIENPAVSTVAGVVALMTFVGSLHLVVSGDRRISSS